MKFLFALSFIVFLYSCASINTKRLVCQYVPEVPSKLIRKTLKSTNKPSATVTFFLKSTVNEIYYDYSRIKISRLDSSEITVVKPDSTGFNETNLVSGYYSMNIHSIESPDLILDSVFIENGHSYTFEILMGELSANQMIEIKEKQTIKRKKHKS